ncbi:MAG: hypothetical protein IJ716_14465 [Lachnospiraceae bacterium]|nr:hypothetical protein [Lachnospiraceae bacterium]
MEERHILSDKALNIIKEFYTRWKQVVEIAEATAPHMVHKTMVYRCRRRECHNIYIMHVEKGLEDPRTDIVGTLEGTLKPVPSTITCPACLSRADHVLWWIDQIYEYKELEKKTNFFINLPNADYGIPVIYRLDARTYAEVYEILGIKLEPVKGTEVNSIMIDDFAGQEDFPTSEPEEFAFGRPNRKSRRHGDGVIFDERRYGRPNRKSRRHGDGVIFDERRYIRPKKGQSKYF